MVTGICAYCKGTFEKHLHKYSRRFCNDICKLLSLTIKTDSCWNFIGKNFQIKVDGKLVLARRLSYNLFIGAIPKGMDVFRSCNCKSCISPSHLFLSPANLCAYCNSPFEKSTYNQICCSTKCRLFHSVIKTDTCWNWIGYKIADGYGRMELNGKLELVHRISYEVHIGLIPEDMLVCHSCDNPPCVNPDHLFLGTNQDNVDDCMRKGRHVTPFGEEHVCSKFTSDEVIYIRSVYKPQDKNFGMRALAKKFNVSNEAIQHIVYNHTWTHLLPT
jgi:hypothetical protein